MKPYIAQIASSLRLMARDRSVLFFSYLFPLTFFFVFAQAFHGGASPGAMSRVVAMVTVIGVLGNGFFGAGIRTVLDRETNILRRFKVAPISAAPIIVASMVSGLVAYLPTVVLFLVLGKLRYHAPFPHALVSLFLFISLALLAFRAMGMIVAAVVNSQQEATIIIQLLYLPMLFLSGGTFPMEMMPQWLQIVAGFLPATYLFNGVLAIMVNNESILAKANVQAAGALLITMAVALFVAIKLFRWEKEEKISGRAKLWILAVLVPFFVAGAYQAYSRENIQHAKKLDRETMRRRTILLRGVNIFVGNGEVVQNGALLIKEGKISQIFKQTPQDTDSLHADIVEAAGKTVIPGLIDMHVHIGSPGGVYTNPQKYAEANLDTRRLAGYLYSGVTTVRSTGDLLDNALELRKKIQDGDYEGAELQSCGPLFTAQGGHPEELMQRFPDFMRAEAHKQFLRQPKTADEGRTQVHELKQAGVNCVKAVLEAGNEHWGKFNRLDYDVYRAVIKAAEDQHLPTATHTGSAADVKVAVEAGSESIEHGSIIDEIAPETFAAMKSRGTFYDPTLSVYEAFGAMASGDTALLDRPLLIQVGPADMLGQTKEYFSKPQAGSFRPGGMNGATALANKNLRAAYQAGVPLIAGTDAGNLLVIHGPTVQRELELWVAAGIPQAVALQAATYNAARALHAENRVGLIKEGLDATFVVLDGDPLRDIGELEHINAVYLRGEHVDRGDLFDQFSKK